MKTLSEYLALPYTLTIKKDEDGDFVAAVVELPGCKTHGSTAGEALARIDEVQQAWIESRIEASLPIPEPSQQDETLPSGKWVQRVARTLHRSLIDVAAREGVSLNQYVATKLAEAVGRQSAQVMSPKAVSGALVGERVFTLPVLTRWSVSVHGAPHSFLYVEAADYLDHLSSSIPDHGQEHVDVNSTGIRTVSKARSASRH